MQLTLLPPGSSSEPEHLLLGVSRLLLLEQEGNAFFSSGLVTFCDDVSCETWFVHRGAP